MSKDLFAGISAMLGNGFAWIAHSEQIWFPMLATLHRQLAPMLGLPDLRGPFIFITLLYVGFRLSDLLEEKDELEENL